MKHLIIYGVFDTSDNDRCIMVGSTVRSLSERVRGYAKEYKWYRLGQHQHRSLWEGNVEDSIFLPFLRASKEACWIGRMKTWWEQGGKNRLNPVTFALGSPNFFTELSILGGKLGARNQPREIRVKLGRATGIKYGRKGAQRMHELHPNLASETMKQTHQLHPEMRENFGKMAAAAGKKGGLIGGAISAHNRWHLRRGIVSPNCKLCKGDS